MLGASKPCGLVDDESKTQIQRSQFLLDVVMAPFPRYRALAANIRSRRKRKPAINIPVYRDQKTQWPFQDPTVDYELHIWPEDDEVRNGAVEENCVYLDSVFSGTCCCSLQVTMQASDIDQARWLYDQLIPLGPVMLALTAATPIFKGHLTDVDVRWRQFAMGLDDRTVEELDQSVCILALPLTILRLQDLQSKHRISKSRASSNSVYISQEARLGSDQQDSNLDIDLHAKRLLEAGGMDEKLATHFAHLFIRDPLTVYEENVDKANEDDTSLFEAIQSSNWQTVRFKPPPSMNSEDIGWRVEFRSMEVQVTDFENATFAVFMILLSQALLHFDVCLYTPIPKVDRNMDQACARDAVIRGRFWFNTGLKQRNDPSASTSTYSSSTEGTRFPDTATHSSMMEKSHCDRESSHSSSEDDNNSTRDANGQSSSNSSISDHAETASCGSKTSIESNGGPSLLTIDEIINGQDSSTGQGFLGLVPLIKEYLQDTNPFDSECIAKIETYLALVSSRARGSAWTSAKWQRDFVRNHPQYREDSVVRNVIAYDMLQAQKEISRVNGKVAAGLGKEMFVV